MGKSITLLGFGLMIGISLQAAVPIKKDSIPESSEIGLRNAYDDPVAGGPNAVYQPVRPTTPLPNSIHVNRDAAINTYTPDDLVRKILLNSHAPADAQRIQNVEHSGWNWNQTTKQWVLNPRVPDNNVWGKAANPGQGGVVTNYDQNERSLTYFSNGVVAGFEIDSGLLMGTGPVMMAEGPNVTNHGMNDGMTNNKATHPTLQNQNTMHGIEEFPSGSFNPTSLFNRGGYYRKHKPGGPWNPDQSFDRDLDALTSDSVIWTTVGSVLEFDFQPAAGVATFDYVFASDEYPEGVYSANDVFGFFVTGPYDAPPGSDIEGTTAAPSFVSPTTIPEHTRTDTLYYRYNIARLPDDKPVGIDYVNWGITNAIYTLAMTTNPFSVTTPADYNYADPNTMTVADLAPYRSISGYDPSPGIATQVNSRLGLNTVTGPFYYVPTNPHLFKYNHVGQDMMEYDGYTVKLQAKADKLIPGKWYHLKLAVAQTVQKNSTTQYLLDNNHGSAVFLANLNLGIPEADINNPYFKDPSFDYKGYDSEGNAFMYDCCDGYSMNIKFDSVAVNSVLAGTSNIFIEYINIEPDAVQKPDGTKLFTFDKTLNADTIKLASLADTLLNYRFRLSTDYDGFENGQYVGVIVHVRPGASDTIFYNPLYTKVDYGKVTFYPTSPMYAGKLEIPIIGGSPALHRSFDGVYWELASKPFSQSQIANMGEEGYILMREPLTCNPIDTIWVGKSPGIPVLQRPIIVPVIEGASTDPIAGKHYVDSRDDFVFTIIPNGANIGMIPVVTTDRKIGNDADGVIIEPQEDGSFIVTIRYVQEPINIFVDFTTSNDNIDNKTVWTNGNQLYILATKTEDAKIYTPAGALYRTMRLKAGETTIITLPIGFYVITMEDGSSAKVIIK